ncbi:hypothetical protein EDF42_3380 [Curtobacterium sp. PhB172]|uniref:hypothetical protein n=1 Tax=Curtobacterium sp. PhB172 TaxID=2485196 RepID=UPI000F4BA619|nr:hypothetical protein [Curtobacterium sp. PhB172]ROS59999.1 hypothetical protein EDF42_3380 [Curtobacterium sp. PhB172]
MLNVNQRLTSALLTAMGAALLPTSCSHKDALPEDYGQAWMSQMSSRYAGDYGGGGGRLVLGDDNPKKATASVALEQDLEGPYDVLAVCRSTKTVHVTIHAFTATPDGSGKSLDTKERLGEADVNCGATTRIPIDVPKDRDGIALDASTNDRSERALFDTFVVTRGAKA